MGSFGLRIAVVAEVLGVLAVFGLAGGGVVPTLGVDDDGAGHRAIVDVLAFYVHRPVAA